MGSILSLARRNSNLQTVLLRRHRTNDERIVSAERVRRLIEIQDDAPVLRRFGDPPMCADAASMQWAADFKARKPKPTNTLPGITYMLAGATQRSDSDPFDKTSPPMRVGPHWMIMWPFDPGATGLPVTHRKTGAYIMWAGSP